MVILSANELDYCSGRSSVVTSAMVGCSLISLVRLLVLLARLEPLPKGEDTPPEFVLFNIWCTPWMEAVMLGEGWIIVLVPPLSTSLIWNKWFSRRVGLGLSLRNCSRF